MVVDFGFARVLDDRGVDLGDGEPQTVEEPATSCAWPPSCGSSPNGRAG
jgi:hypothetical protein